MKLHAKLILNTSLLGLTMMFSGCTSDGENGATSLTNTSVEAAGVNCVNGGTRIDSGIDDNANGTLEESEIDSTSYVCGSADGSALTNTTVEPAGANCNNGGTRLDTGLDDNDDGILEESEIDSTSYICNATDGLSALTNTTTEPEGANCDNGGTRIDTGMDDNANGTLEESEIDSTSYVCNAADGTDGLTALTNTTAEPAGANCADGGTRIDIGVDDNTNGTLETSEIDTTSYICNAPAAEDGYTTLTRLITIGEGDNCTYGGVLIAVGLDTNRDGYLDSREIGSTRYVCNGIIPQQPEGPQALQGKFIDSEVQGLDYDAQPSKLNGLTDVNGNYDFEDGDLVEFSLGCISLGSTKGTTNPVSPVDLFEGATSSDQRVINIARVLQSLDVDGDPRNGINIIETSVARLITELDGSGNGCNTDLSTYTSEDLGILLTNVVDKTSMPKDRVVSELEASDHLDSTLADGNQTGLIFRKNISKTPELHSSKPKMNIMTIYVDAQTSDGEPVYDDDNITRLRVRPLVATYADSVEGAGLLWDGTAAHDAFAAISLDDGNTWKRMNLSRTATRSSFDIKDGDSTRPYPGDSHKPVMQTRGNNIFVIWDDKFCRSGNPMDFDPYDKDTGLPLPADTNVSAFDGNVTYPDDLYLVNGSQRSVDYAEMSVNGEYPYVEVGEIPYGCVMASRIVIDPEAELASEVITTYVAEQITSGRRDALQIFVASDPGTKAFVATWQEDPAGLRPGSGKGPGAGWGGATTNHNTDVWYTYITAADFAVIDVDHDPSGDPVQTSGDDDNSTRPHALNKLSAPVRISNNAVCSKEKADANLSAKYCKYMCDEFGVYNNDADENDTSNGKCYGPGIDPITGEQFVLNGDTGASRPNIFIQSGEVIFGYEETKGLGDGAPDYSEEGLEQGGPSDDINWTDTGKYVIYDSFPFQNPENLTRDSFDEIDDYVVSGGHILNVPNSEGIYENARRIRFIPQGKKSMQTSVAKIVLGAVYKEGMEGQGRPSDIMLARWKGGYAFDNVVGGTEIGARINISSVTPTELNATAGEDSNGTKVLAWDWSEANLDDDSDTNPYDDARAHRGQIRGDMLVVGYSYTPNWAAARIAHDKYDFFVRRSFDGGETWTDSNGTSEGPRNLTNLPNNKETVIEPRLVATPGTIDEDKDGFPDGEHDKQNKNIFFVTYGTAENVPNVVGSLDPDDVIKVGAPRDLFYARTTDKGDTYEFIDKNITSEESNLTGETVTVWDWLAHSNAEEGEVQIRMTPDGSVFYSSWIQELDMDDTTTADHFKGSDIWFRKIDYNTPE